MRPDSKRIHSQFRLHRLLTIRTPASGSRLRTVVHMNFSRNSIAAVVAVVASLTAGSAALAFNLGGADTGVPSPAGRLTSATAAVPSTIYVDQPVLVQVPGSSTSSSRAPHSNATSTTRKSSAVSGGDGSSVTAASADHSSSYEGHDDDD